MAILTHIAHLAYQSPTIILGCNNPCLVVLFFNGGSGIYVHFLGILCGVCPIGHTFFELAPLVCGLKGTQQESDSFWVLLCNHYEVL